MKASELRIGNWVNTIEGHKQIIELRHSENYPKGISHHVTDNVRVSGLFLGPIGGVLPIPLTEDCLKNKELFVKEWKGNGADYQPETSKTKQVHYKLFENCYCVFETWSYRKDEYSEWINEHSVFVIYSDNQISLYKHEVHVLQNLIFALTGEELELK